MTEQQAVHVGMINSYNVLMGNISVEFLLDINLGVFSHDFSRDPRKETIENIIKYFEECEMFIECFELSGYIRDNFDEKGRYIRRLCECEKPVIKEYSYDTKCDTCKRSLTD